MSVMIWTVFSSSLLTDENKSENPLMFKENICGSVCLETWNMNYCENGNIFTEKSEMKQKKIGYTVNDKWYKHN